MRIPHLVFAVSAALVVSASAQAQTATGNFNVRMTVTGECRLNTTNDLDFGSAGIFTSNIDQQTTLGVQCSNGTPFSIGLGQGLNGASVTDRRMKHTSGTDTVTYQLFRDSARTQNWGTTAGTDTFAGIGTGANQSVNIFARVPPQTNVAAGTYSDVITITVNY